jgi:hypothetical protein
MASQRALSQGNASFSDRNHCGFGVDPCFDLPTVVAPMKGRLVEIGLKAKDDPNTGEG